MHLQAYRRPSQVVYDYVNKVVLPVDCTACGGNNSSDRTSNCTKLQQIVQVRRYRCAASGCRQIETLKHPIRNVEHSEHSVCKPWRYIYTGIPINSPVIIRSGGAVLWKQNVIGPDSYSIHWFKKACVGSE